MGEYGMTMKYPLFSSLFKSYRLRCGIETLKEFGDLLAAEGSIYENTIFTRWQNGQRFPKDRKTVLNILRVFIKKGAIVTLEEVDKLLRALGQAELTFAEVRNLESLFVSKNKVQLVVVVTWDLRKDNILNLSSIDGLKYCNNEVVVNFTANKENKQLVEEIVALVKKNLYRTNK